MRTIIRTVLITWGVLIVTLFVASILVAKFSVRGMDSPWFSRLVIAEQVFVWTGYLLSMISLSIAKFT